MTNWTFKQKSGNKFMSSFSPEVKKYLDIKDEFPFQDLARWLLDSFQLMENNWSNTYGDYSFIVMPASKALESWVFKIAEDLDVEINTIKAGVVVDQIKSKINEELEEAERKAKKSIKRDIDFLKNFIQEYRNDIVHCDKKIESPNKARNKVITIYERLNSITEKLIKAGLISIS